MHAGVALLCSSRERGTVWRHGRVYEGADTPAWLCTEAASELVGVERGGFYQDRSLEALGGGWKAAIEGSLDEYMAAKHAAAAEKPKSG